MRRRPRPQRASRRGGRAPGHPRRQQPLAGSGGGGGGEPGQWARLDRALELARPSGELSRLAPVASARCEAAWLEGRDADALAETELAWDAARRVADPWLLGDLAQWRRR